MAKSQDVGFPWDVHVLDILLLLEHVPHNGIPAAQAFDLIKEYAAAHERATVSSADPFTLIDLPGRGKRAAIKFLKSLSDVDDETRQKCCRRYSAGVRLVGGRAMKVDFETQNDVFDDTPLGWVVNALWSVEPIVLPIKYPISLGTFIRCAPLAFKFTDDVTSAKRKATPWIYTGTESCREEIHRHRASHWMGDIDAGYAAAGKMLQEAWCQQVPSARQPDPVYSFLDRPSAKRCKEALRFARCLWRQISGKKEGHRKRGRSKSPEKQQRDRLIRSVYGKEKGQFAGLSKKEIYAKLFKQLSTGHPEFTFSVDIIRNALRRR